MTEPLDKNSVEWIVSDINTKLTAHVEDSRVFRQRLDTRLDMQHERIDVLENERQRLLGFSVGLGAAAGGLGAWLYRIFLP